MAFSNSTSPEIIWGLGGPEEDHQLNHCCWAGRVGEREEEDQFKYIMYYVNRHLLFDNKCLPRLVTIYFKGLIIIIVIIIMSFNVRSV